MSRHSRTDCRAVSGSERLEWRGLGFISHSALKVRDSFAAYDAERRFAIPGVRVADPKACQCDEVLKGVLKSWECKVFGTACTPETPLAFTFNHDTVMKVEACRMFPVRLWVSMIASLRLPARFTHYYDCKDMN